MSNSKKVVTVEDIAAKANVSRMTVYKVLNKKGNVKEKTKHAVETACRELNYQVNYAARALASNIVQDICVSYFIQPLREGEGRYTNLLKEGFLKAEKELRDYRLNLIYDHVNYGESELQVKQIYDRFEEGVENFIVVPYSMESVSQCISDLTPLGAKFVTLNRDCPHSPRLSYVGSDYLASGRLCGEILSQISAQGALLIVVSELFDSDSYSMHRFNGICQEAFRTQKLQNFYRIVRRADRTEFDKELKKILQTENISAIVDLAGELSHISDYLYHTNHYNDIALIGFDLYKEYIPYLVTHQINCIIDQGLQDQAYTAVKTFFQYLNFNISIQTHVYSPITPLFVSNYQYFTSDMT